MLYTSPLDHQQDSQYDRESAWQPTEKKKLRYHPFAGAQVPVLEPDDDHSDENRRRR